MRTKDALHREPAPPLDVERLARAFHAINCPGLPQGPTDWCSDDGEDARRIAAEYARLGSEAP